MAVDTNTILTPNWQIGNSTYGEVVTDGDDILQCIHNILFTPKYSVPFYPEFGSLLFRLVDLPINKIKAAVVNEVYSAIVTYEKRVTITAMRGYGTGVEGGFTWEIDMLVTGTSKKLNYELNLDTDKTGGRAFSDGFSSSFS